ncbi:MAG: tRNA (adenosine(37)-N6)-threonylcarbamoyltransferase complex dimerization subunit type 1 TsaB [Spirochaetaceae bacterium]|jgi:tRNA threonylcarbamoyladenosine biosynthesis protein TsaB|nr:tRNA (adenosine(37)-N6)-threonylcarbamoyltransferase complex dimerization subunit type 1 TsaB [Spirochaetaceae bacterium]
MNIFCLDTSGPVLSAALQWDGGVVSLEVDAGGKHSGLLLSVMDNLLKTAGVKPIALDLAACMRGPGSWTGIRVGFAAVKGIAAAHGATAVSIPTLDCMALPFMDGEADGTRTVARKMVVPAIDSRRQQFYTAVYRGGERVTDYLDVQPDALVPMLRGGSEEVEIEEEILLTGPDADKLRGVLSGLLMEKHEKRLSVDPYFSRGQARNMLRFLAKGDRMKWDGELSVPLYIRKSDAEEKWQKL